MTILLDLDNKKILSKVSNGFVEEKNGILEYNGNPHKCVKYDGIIPEVDEEKGEYLEWDDVKKEIVLK